MIIKQQLVLSRSVTFGEGNPCRFITIHETANESVGAGAQTHANLQSRGYRASWHFQVDDKEVIQSFPETVRCWHAGDGRGDGNMESIAIEICVNQDSDFKKAVDHTVDLVKHLMEKHHISIDHVVQHNHWSGKDCPRYLRNGAKGVSWADFKSKLTGSPVTQVKTESSVSKPLSAESKGNSIVDYLNSIGVDSSYTNRAKLAAQYNISNYRGTAEQNLELLNLMRSGKSVSAPTPNGNMATDSVVDYLKSIGADSSFAHRTKLAEQYGIQPYTGTAAQNLELLGKLRKTSVISNPSVAKKGDQKTTSIVDYLKSIGVDSSFANRKKLAAANGINNYTGSAAQNTQLLKKLRG